jgi:NADPH:quinone reductase-like Zn-dependent oxidoreductase
MVSAMVAPAISQLLFAILRRRATMETFMTTRARRNILITGAGSGLGKAFATEALSSGHCAVETVRSEDARLAFDALHPARVVPTP